MRESNYWLRICYRLKLGDQLKCQNLVSESEELKKILGSIASKTIVKEDMVEYKIEE
jgi:four helix bundle protein